jgi:hypothetical protein
MPEWEAEARKFHEDLGHTLSFAELHRLSQARDPMVCVRGIACPIGCPLEKFQLLCLYRARVASILVLQVLEIGTSQ